MIFGDPPYKKFLVTKPRDHIHGSAGVQVTAAYKTRESAVLTEGKILLFTPSVSGLDGIF